MSNTGPNDWDEGHPLITDRRKAGAGEILALRQAIRARLDKEHQASVTGDVTLGLGGGEHKEGSAVIYVGATAPTLRPDGLTTLSSADEGRLWLDTDTLWLYYYKSGTGWVKINDGPSPQITQFEKTDGGSSPTIPLTQTGLTPGTWIVWVEGTTIDGSGSAGFTTSITVNGITRTCVITNVPDGTAPFCIACHITVTDGGGGTGSISLTAASNVQRIMKMHGILTVAS